MAYLYDPDEVYSLDVIWEDTTPGIRSHLMCYVLLYVCIVAGVPDGCSRDNDRNNRGLVRIPRWSQLESVRE